MKLKNILQECIRRGYPISAQGLYSAGERNGFITNVTGTRENPNPRIFDREKFEEWLKGALEDIPEGYISVNEASKELNVGLNRIYNAINYEGLDYKKIGSGKGIYYVDRERIKEHLKNYKPRSNGRRGHVTE